MYFPRYIRMIYATFECKKKKICDTCTLLPVFICSTLYNVCFCILLTASQRTQASKYIFEMS